MAARGDQVHSHQFTFARVTAALTVGDADPVASPVRRSAGAALTTVMLAVVALAAVAVYGVVRPGDDGAWRDGHSVIVERETGARFVLRDGVLHPALNYASALLVLGSAQPATAIVARAALATVPRGAPLGIAGAPDALPGPADLLTGAWTVCSRPAPSTVESVLIVGGTPTAALTAVADRGVLARDPGGGLQLLWHGRRYALPAPTVALTALGWRARTPTPVATALLAALPVGANLVAPPVADRGARSPLPGYRVGDVVVIAGATGGRQYALVTAAGLAALTPVEAALSLADPRAGGQPARPLSPAGYAVAPTVDPVGVTGPTALPAEVPDLVEPGPTGAMCASFVDGTGVPALAITAGPATAPGELPSQGGVDRVAVAPGRGAVVTVPGDGLLGVVSDLGVLFPVPSTEVLGTLGYAGVVPRPLPAALLALLASGSALDPAAITSTA